jgi:hypothetical protein
MAAVVIPFKHQSVRDLAWAISSPPLVLQPDQSCRWPDSRWYQCAYEESLPWFRKVDEDPSELEDMLDKQKDRRLGKVFETLWLYWFSHHPRYEVIENNLQIIVDGETLGEIDFIVFDKVSNQMVHWEVAVKFYLGAIILSVESFVGCFSKKYGTTKIRRLFKGIEFAATMLFKSSA